MKITSILSASALVLAFGLAVPASAQVASGTVGGAATATGILNSATTNTTSTDIGVSDFLNTDVDVDLDSHDNNSTNNSNNTAIAVSDFLNDKSVRNRSSWEYNLSNDSHDGNDSSSVVASQTLLAVNANAAPLNFMSLALSNYGSGDNSVSGSAFAAYAGILNQGWNTGINANAQAATNIAARGTVTFSQ
jgi:hypothetical protein